MKFEEAGLSVGRPVKFFTRTFETDKLVRLHYHRSLEVNICRGVQGELRLGDRVIDLSEDCIIILPPETPHSYRFPSCKGTVEVCHILLEAFPGADKVLEGLLSLKSISVDDCSPAAVSHLYSLTNPAAKPAELYGWLLLFLSSFEGRGESISAVGDRFLRSVIDYAEEHFSGRISLDDVCRAAGVSRFHFCRKFKERTGENWAVYLRSLRLSNSMNQLRAGCSVSEAAEKSGFESVSYYISCFKAQYGLTPLEWQKTETAFLPL